MTSKSELDVSPFVMDLKNIICDLLADDGFEVSFKSQFIKKFNRSAQKIAILVTNEFEGISSSGDIGIHYATLSEQLAADGWYVILLLCQSSDDFEGESKLPNIKHIFSTHKIEQFLNFQRICHEAILAKAKQTYLSQQFDFHSFCCLFFVQAIVKNFIDAVVYVDVPEKWGFGYRTIQAKQTGLLGSSCLITVSAYDGGYERSRETNSEYIVDVPQWWWQAYHYEQFSYEKADLTIFPSEVLQSKVESYGVKTSHAVRIPYNIPLLNLSEPEKEEVNQRSFNQRLEYMSQAFLNSAPRTDKNPKVTIVVNSLNAEETLEDCLESIAKQTYNNLDVVVLYQTIDESPPKWIARLQPQFPRYQFVGSDVNESLGATYNKLINQQLFLSPVAPPFLRGAGGDLPLGAGGGSSPIDPSPFSITGDYFLPFDAANTALPFMVEKFVTAISQSEAVAVVCAQMHLNEDLEIANLMDGGLLKLLEFNYHQDACGLFSVELLREFPYSEVKELLALNWHIIAAIVATGKEIAYYPYPLYLAGESAESKISSANLPKERYYLRQYLSQISPEKWSRRQLNLLLTGIEQLLQLVQDEQKIPAIAQQVQQEKNAQPSSLIQIAQQYPARLRQNAAKVDELSAWIAELEYGKEWLESQRQAWMQEAQKAVAAWEQSQATIQQMQSSKFWKLQRAWMRIKRSLKIG